MVCATFLVLKKSRTRGSRPALLFWNRGQWPCLIFGSFQTRGVPRILAWPLTLMVENRTSNVDHERFRSDSNSNCSDLLVQMCLLKILINLSVGNCSFTGTRAQHWKNLLITNLTHSFKHTCTFHAFKWGSEFKSNNIVSNLQSSQLNTKQNEQNEQMLHF